MLDTVKLHLKEYEVTPGSELQVQPATYRVGTGEPVGEFYLFSDTSGREHKGSKAYLNIENKCNLTIQPYSRNVGTACFLQFSVPKIHYGSNYYSVGREGTIGVLENVEQELVERGIKSKLKEAQLSRVDTFKNIITEEPYTSYYSLFALLRARRAVQRGYGTTWLVHNTQQEFCIYDKLVELQARGEDITKLPANTMRFEHRLLNHAKTEAVYGFGSVKVLVGSGYEVVRTRQLEQWQKSLFCHSVEEVVILGARQLESDMRAFQVKYGRGWFGMYLKAFGAYSLVEQAGAEAVKQALYSLEQERTKVWRAERVLAEAKRTIELLREEPTSKKTLAVLYKELQSKVLLN